MAVQILGMLPTDKFSDFVDSSLEALKDEPCEELFRLARDYSKALQAKLHAGDRHAATLLVDLASELVEDLTDLIHAEKHSETFALDMERTLFWPLLVPAIPQIRIEFLKSIFENEKLPFGRATGIRIEGKSSDWGSPGVKAALICYRLLSSIRRGFRVTSILGAPVPPLDEGWIGEVGGLPDLNRDVIKEWVPCMRRAVTLIYGDSPQCHDFFNRNSNPNIPVQTKDEVIKKVIQAFRGVVKKCSPKPKAAGNENLTPDSN